MKSIILTALVLALAFATPANAKTQANAAGVEKEQCSATTKKGTQCSRNATATGFCWQHEKANAAK